MAELWDAYDKKFNKIENTTLVRGETIPDGIYHLVSEVIVKHTDGSYLLMQRDLRKHHGGEWEVTAGGSALQGENGLEAAIRELKEETGLNADKMKEITRVVHDGHHSLYIIFPNGFQRSPCCQFILIYFFKSFLIHPLVIYCFTLLQNNRVFVEIRHT